MNPLAHRLISSGVLAVWAAVLCIMVLTGRIGSYLHPAFHPYTFAAGVILALLAFLVLVAPDLEAGGCSPAETRGSLGHTLLALTLVGPLLLAFGGSDSAFSANTVRNRLYVQDVTQLPGAAPRVTVEPALPEESPAAAETAELFTGPGGLPRTATGELQAEVIDLLYAAQLPELRPEFDNQRVQLIGQLMPTRGPNPQGNRHDLIRMFMTCCAADAQPVAVTVEAAQAPAASEMSWVKVTGKATFPLEGGQRTALVVEGAIEPTEPPKETLIY